MREIDARILIEPLGALIGNALVGVDAATRALIKEAARAERSPAARWALGVIEENNEIAVRSRDFACQDCGLAVLFVSVGQDVHINGGLTDALNEGVKRGYAAARKSVADPLTRLNTGTNTPAVVHYDVTDGDKIAITFLAKGAGAENMSRVFMLTPSKGEAGIIDCAVRAVTDAGANPCPPVILGVGVGGTMEKCALLAKLALTRGVGKRNPDKRVAELEDKILEAVNATGIGAQGFGGGVTALAAAVETFPTHIGMLPVAVNIQCHSVREGRLII
ncbi:MAG: fumarate hydratase [Clostridiales bacterium]|jgi:fumarate hydratase subunit alpha|nr:fumarate hydratase [Clostridiales bacterium]